MGSVEVTVISARELKNVNWKNGELKAYAVVWIDPAVKCSTRADGVHDTDPIWDDKLTIPLPPTLSIDDAVLSVDVVHAADPSAAAKVKPLVGSARLPLREVLADGGTCARTLRLTRPSGRPQGKLDLKISVREPPRHYGYPYGAPPPPPPYAYGAPAPSGYGYGGAPPQPAERGYGYGSTPPQPAAAAAAGSKSKFGMGTGLAVGAAAGILGGLALAEGVDLVEDKIAADVEDKIADDVGYDDDGDY